MNIKKIESFLSGALLVVLGLLILVPSFYGLFWGQYRDPNKFPTANIVFMLIGIIITAAPFIKAFKNKALATTNKNLPKIGNLIGAFFNILAKVTIGLTVVGTLYMVVFIKSGGASGIPIFMGVLAAGFFKFLGSLFKDYYGNA